DGALAHARNCGRVFRRSIGKGGCRSLASGGEDMTAGCGPACAGREILRRQALTALGAPTGDHLGAGLGRHTSAEAVTARTHESGRLKSPLHRSGSGSKNEPRWIVERRGGVKGASSFPPLRSGGGGARAVWSRGRGKGLRALQLAPSIPRLRDGGG